MRADIKGKDNRTPSEIHIFIKTEETSHFQSGLQRAWGLSFCPHKKKAEQTENQQLFIDISDLRSQDKQLPPKLEEKVSAENHSLPGAEAESRSTQRKPGTSTRNT